MIVPKQLRNENFRFVLLKSKSKVPFETGWQKNGYKYNDPKLLQHIKDGGNCGVIGGYGNLRIIDIDDRQLGETIEKQLNTFTIKTGGGGKHLYIISDYNTNHVFMNKWGEYRANRYQVVAPNCTHPNGKRYEIVNDTPILKVPYSQLRHILKPLLRDPTTRQTHNSKEREYGNTDTSRSGREFAEVCKLIRQGKSKEQVFEEMHAFTKWANAPVQYRELTYQKGLSVIQHKPSVNVQQDVIKLLDEPETETTYLDLGYNDDVWYYGFNLGGKEAIITSDKRVLRNTRERIKDANGERWIGENEIKEVADYTGYIGDIAPTIRRQVVKDFLTNEQNIDKREVFETVKNKILYYMDFGDKPEIADVQACWVIGTHCYPLFYWFPHILFHAPSDSGKSKNAYILMQLGFRGFDLGASAGVTPAQIFRTLEANRGTTRIDEFEKLEKSETQQLVNQILNASASKDSYVIRTEQINKKWKAWKFPIFCPKIVCNITGINPTSMSRYIAFNLLKTLDTTKGKRKPEREKEKASFPPIRDKTSLLILQSWKETKDVYDNLELDLINRDADNWLPICAVAKWIGEDVYKNVLEYIDTYKEIRIESNDLTETLFKTIYENVTDKDDFYKASVIAGWMSDELSSFKSPATWIGKQLKNYYLKPVHRSSGRFYLLNKEKVQNIINRYFGTEVVSQDTQTTLPTEDSLASPKSSDNSKKGEASDTGDAARKVEWSDSNIYHHICNFENCINRECNLLNYKLFCKEHWYDAGGL